MAFNEAPVHKNHDHQHSNNDSSSSITCSIQCLFVCVRQNGKDATLLSHSARNRRSFKLFNKLHKEYVSTTSAIEVNRQVTSSDTTLTVIGLNQVYLITFCR